MLLSRLDLIPIDGKWIPFPPAINQIFPRDGENEVPTFSANGQQSNQMRQLCRQLLN